MGTLVRTKPFKTYDMEFFSKVSKWVLDNNHVAGLTEKISPTRVIRHAEQYQSLEYWISGEDHTVLAVEFKILFGT